MSPERRLVLKLFKNRRLHRVERFDDDDDGFRRACRVAGAWRNRSPMDHAFHILFPTAPENIKTHS